jgi:hypothetical protein
MEQAVILHLPLRSGPFGSPEEREALLALEDQLAAAVVENAAGEFDGDEFGEGECVLFLYGPDADSLFAAIEPALKASSQASGGYAIKRYGEATDMNAQEVRVAW